MSPATLEKIDSIALADPFDLEQSFFRAVQPKKDLSLSDWSDKNRVLPATSSHESGPWRTSRFPYTRRIMDLLSESNPARVVTLMKGSQVAGTEIIINWMTYTIDHAPAPFMYVQKTLDAIKVFLEQRWESSMDEMPKIKNKIGSSSESRSSGDTAKLKMFPGGMIRFSGANSATSLRSTPIKNLALDEEDDYDADIQDQGSPSSLAIARTKNFPDSKVFHCSSPNIKETSVIEPLFEAGTKERYFVPCPFCNNFDWIRWKNIKYINDDPDTAELLCEACGVLIPETYKTQMLEGGKWVAENPKEKDFSFHISGLYSPYGFYSWGDAVKEYVFAIRTHDNAKLKVFINTVLGETWTEAGKTIRAGWLEGRKEPYRAQVPKACVVLTCGADVQDDRIECEVVGWGPGLESFGIEYKIFRGDTERNQVWLDFDKFIQSRFKHESGTMLPISCTGLDSGHRTKVVYNFCSVRQHRYVYPVKGADGWGKGDLDRPRKKNKYKVFAFRAFVDEIKNKIYSYLQVSDPGPGYSHFPDLDCYDSQYFKQLTSETLKKVWSNGKYKLRWMLPNGRRNEALDCRTYAFAALSIIFPDFGKLPINEPIILNQNGKGKYKRKEHSKGI